MPKVATAVREGRRQQVIEAAWRCAARRKFAELTVDEICAEASLSKGAFYAYFDSKQMLLFALLNEEASSIDRLMAELKAADLTGVERLRRFARGMLERGESPGHAQVRADLWAEGLADEVVRDRLSVVIRERRARLRRWIEQSIRVGELPPVPANALAAIVLALGDGLLLHAGLDPAAFSWSNIRRAFETLVEGASKVR